MRGPQPRIALSNAKRRKILPEWPGQVSRPGRPTAGPGCPAV